MARTAAMLTDGSRITDYISLGVVAKAFPRALVEDVLKRTGKMSDLHHQDQHKTMGAPAVCHPHAPGLSRSNGTLNRLGSFCCAVLGAPRPPRRLGDRHCHWCFGALTLCAAWPQEEIIAEDAEAAEARREKQKNQHHADKTRAFR
jgi:hypothetical protein